ncbi:hypothetical protein QBC47DRAFT_383175 [Echria macrotheca]|uniref:Helix-turn-helix domain-containing protein n=1 Tax=Echria macrotheca TaxID=438768 RepID=A0AAJ0BBJ0_9PEZI|nr:hypothetical protein QBC47DRAFT_383175 [Echria macrotheca]
MGASGSKAAKSGARKFPTRAPGSSIPPSSAQRAARQAPVFEQRHSPQASYTKDDAIKTDSVDPSGDSELVDPAFADRLRQMGIVQPNPTFSPSSTAASFQDMMSTAQSSMAAPKYPPSSSNPTLAVLEARRRLQEKAEQEFEELGVSGAQGREFLDINTIRNILVMRQRGESAAAIESRLRLKPGVVARLGPPGIVSPTSGEA